MAKAHRLQVGSVVLCRWFNRPENKFYKDAFIGTVEDIEDNHFFSRGHVEKGFVVRVHKNNMRKVTLTRKEIRKILEA